MKLTEREKEICREYSKRGDDGLVRCNECPLALDTRYCICYANLKESDPDYAYYEGIGKLRRF